MDLEDSVSDIVTSKYFGRSQSGSIINDYTKGKDLLTSRGAAVTAAETAESREVHSGDAYHDVSIERRADASVVDTAGASVGTPEG